ncbi:MAG: hypothetical protein GX247_01840 [Mollicutes bacterium]|nr:hypothetical protein [Mollicutes bacterium]
MKYMSNKLLVIIIIGFVLINTTGCKNKEYNAIKEVNTIITVENDKLIKNINNNKTSTYSTKISTNTENTTKVNDDNQSNNNITTYSTNQNDVNKDSNKEDKIIKYFNDIKDNVSKYVNESNLNEVKDKINEAFITIIDFIFYEKEINGITFNSLGEKAKEEIIKVAKEIDAIIVKKYPDYKIVIKGKLENIKNYISYKIDLAKNHIKDNIGEDNYNNIKDKYNNIKENIKKITNKTLDNIEKWYENKRNNH